MKTISLWAITGLLLLPLCNISAQDSKERSLADLSPKEKMQILANQIELRDDRIKTMEKEMTRLQRKETKAPTKVKSEDKKLQQIVKKLAQTELDLLAAKEEKDQLNTIIADLRTQINTKPISTSTSSPETAALISELQSKLSNTQNENTKLIAKLRVSEDQLNERQAQVVSLMSSQNNYTTSNVSEESSRKKKKSKYEELPIEKAPVHGKNYFYITAAQNLSLDNNYGIEIGSIKSFNKRSSKAVRLGLDVAYLSANLRNLDLKEVDNALDQPTGAVGIKIGPNINVRIMKGIIFNTSYRFFPAANLTTTIDEEIDVQYKGFHTAGASLKVGPIIGRFELDLTKDEQIDQSIKIADAPMTVYLGLMF